MKLDLTRYNERIKEATTGIVQEIKQTGSSMDVRHREGSPSKTPSLPKVKGSFKKGEDKSINQVSIKFPRVLIYTHKGAGKGRGGNKGSSWLDKYGVAKKTNPKSLGKMGTGGRKEKPFINRVLDSENGVDRIATIAAEELGDAIVNNMLIK